METAIKWVSEDSIEDYMGKHQHDEDALPLWEYFQSVINWVESTFTNTRPAMKGIDWGSLHNDFRDADLDADAIEQETARLILDDDVTRKTGIYFYILTREEFSIDIPPLRGEDNGSKTLIKHFTGKGLSALLGN